MEIEERMAKAETEIETLKETQRTLQAAMERGFAEQRAAMAELRIAMDRGFAEERAARERAFRWSFSATLSILALVLGIIAKLAGAF